MVRSYDAEAPAEPKAWRALRLPQAFTANPRDAHPGHDANPGCQSAAKGGPSDDGASRGASDDDGASPCAGRSGRAEACFLQRGYRRVRLALTMRRRLDESYSPHIALFNT